MFSFIKKKTPEPPKPTVCEEVRRQLSETDTRLDKAIKEMHRRLAARERGLVAVK